MELLLRAGEAVDQVASNGRAALIRCEIWSSRNDDQAGMELLLRVGVAVDQAANDGCTALIYTVPFRVRVHTITPSVHLNDPFWLQAQTGTRIQRAVQLLSAQ